MADVVIVVGSKRGPETVSVAAIRQMCVSEDTPVFIAGQRSFAKKALDVVVGDVVVGIDDSTMNTVKASVVKVFYSSGLAKRICFNNGSELVCSHHPLKLWDGGWVDSDGLGVGDKVCVVTASKYQSGCLSLWEKIRDVLRKADMYCRVYGDDLRRLRDMTISDIVGVCGVHHRSVCKIKKTGVMTVSSAVSAGFDLRYFRSKNGSEVDLALLRHDDLAWALGMIASDGNVKCDKNHTLFRLFLRNKSMVQHFADIFVSLGFKGVRVVKVVGGNGGKDYWGCSINSFVFVKFLVAMGITPNKSRSLNLSEFVDLNVKDKLGFMSGVIDGDGSFDAKSGIVRICTASRIAAYNMRDMLLSSGLYATVGRFTGSGSVFGYLCDTTHYVVSMRRKDDVIDFANRCGFSVKIPNSVRSFRRTRPLMGDCFYTRVKSIEDVGMTKMVNFTVAGCESFVCDGIVTHNCGRAGRRHGGAACEAFVLVDSEDVVDVEEGLAGDAKYTVSSSMTSCDDLVFHMVAEICAGNISDEDDAARWYSRSFGAAQGRRPDLKVAFAKLVECGALEVVPPGYVPTEMAKIAAKFYFHPANVRAWRDNFSKVFEMGLESNDAAVAWALGSVPVADSPGDFGQHRFVMSLYKEELPTELEAMPGTVARGTLWWSALGGPSVGRMRNAMLELRKDFGRVSRALVCLDRAEDWGMEAFFTGLTDRVRRGVPERLADLCSIDGMPKGLAEFLYNAGVNDREGIKDALDSLEGELDEGSVAFLREVANGLR